MKKLNFLFLFIVAFGFTQNNKILTDDLTTIFELSNGTETPTYFQTIQYFEKLASRFDEIQIVEISETDSGHPLHLVVYNTNKEFDFNKIHLESKPILLINNAIHPGEPDGVDASMLLLRNLALNKNNAKDVILAVIQFTISEELWIEIVQVVQIKMDQKNMVLEEMLKIMI